MDSAPTLASSLLRTQYLSSAALNLSTGVGSGIVNTSGMSNKSFRFLDTSLSSKVPPQYGISANSRTPSKKLPRYSLQSGYDKYVALPTSGTASNQQFNRPKVVTPQHVDTLLPLNESIMNPSNIKQLADCGLYMSRSFRVGWSNYWILANPGKSLHASDLEPKGPTEISIEQQTVSSYGFVDQEQLSSLESWLEVCLENSNIMLEDCENGSESIPLFESIDGLDTLSAFANEATRQALKGSTTSFRSALEEAKQILDLMVALWGRLPYLPVQAKEEDMDVEESDTEQLLAMDSHEITMRRKEALSDWLECVVELKMKESVNAAKQLSDKNRSLIAEELALLSGKSLIDACDRAQAAGDHYSAILTAQAAGGSNSICSQMTFRYMEILQVGYAMNVTFTKLVPINLSRPIAPR